MSIEVRQVDPGDESALRAYWEVGSAVSAHDRADDDWPAWETARTGWALPDPVRRMPKLAAYDGAEAVGTCSLQLDDLDNTHLALVIPAVRPERRGRGVGTALLDAAEALARADGRTTVVSEVHTAPGDATAPALGFAERRGYAVAGTEEVKVADLTATRSTWPALARHAAERAGAYTLVTWREHAPDEHVDEIARLYTRFLGEIPLGDLDLGPQTWSPQRIRDNEERQRRIGKRQVLVAAVAPDGTLAGYTNLWLTDARPDRADIDSTLVLPEHRGHRLGLALKVRLHEETVRHHPGVRRVATGNAAVNRWMNAVNESLGYRVVETCLELQKVLG